MCINCTEHFSIYYLIASSQKVYESMFSLWLSNSPSENSYLCVPIALFPQPFPIVPLWEVHVEGYVCSFCPPNYTSRTVKIALVSQNTCVQMSKFKCQIPINSCVRLAKILTSLSLDFLICKMGLEIQPQRAAGKYKPSIYKKLFLAHSRFFKKEELLPPSASPEGQG